MGLEKNIWREEATPIKNLHINIWSIGNPNILPPSTVRLLPPLFAIQNLLIMNFVFRRLIIPYIIDFPLLISHSHQKLKTNHHLFHSTLNLLWLQDSSFVRSCSLSLTHTHTINHLNYPSMHFIYVFITIHSFQEILNEEDEKIARLKDECSKDVCNAVVTKNSQMSTIQATYIHY